MNKRIQKKRFLMSCDKDCCTCLKYFNRMEKLFDQAIKIIRKLMDLAEMDNREYEDSYKEAEQFLKKIK